MSSLSHKNIVRFLTCWLESKDFKPKLGSCKMLPPDIDEFSSSIRTSQNPVGHAGTNASCHQPEINTAEELKDSDGHQNHLCSDRSQQAGKIALKSQTFYGPDPTPRIDDSFGFQVEIRSEGEEESDDEGESQEQQ